ncbi:MAG: hypothetical protein OQJ96_05810 [Flavobacteriales bacterium]|nr:hypothetical protein [Flavobacteriales bacterium]MCW8911938.1 hypothetical protein [Flavobacteriales bacterium]MCW8937592.1 hypothetical protein [Flavobacteriales bacterium]MCW8941098.1 hypothetical protein [Flavobacteriales bacterium]MCW8968068.1 hypothetical protein [Flavobacteriales bacterium]
MKKNILIGLIITILFSCEEKDKSIRLIEGKCWKIVSIDTKLEPIYDEVLRINNKCRVWCLWENGYYYDYDSCKGRETDIGDQVITNNWQLLQNDSIKIGNTVYNIITSTDDSLIIKTGEYKVVRLKSINDDAELKRIIKKNL